MCVFWLQLKCRQDHLPECLSPRRTETVIHNFLVGEFRKAFNLTETLGEEVISGCPTLVRNEGKVLRVFAGSDRCTFRQVLGARIGLSECLQDARDEKDFRLRLLKLAPNPKYCTATLWQSKEEKILQVMVTFLFLMCVWSGISSSTPGAACESASCPAAWTCRAAWERIRARSSKMRRQGGKRSIIFF